MTETISYIDNNPVLGVCYDWPKIIAAYKALHCPDTVYSPCKTIREGTEAGCRWYVGMSKRETGKTTNWLLIGLIMWWMYGTQIQYVRQDEDMIAPKNTKDMFNVILEHDYISTITEGQYNTIVYRSRRWYLAKREDGIITAEASEHCCFMCDVVHYEDLKSGYNAPLGDLIIFDEFISTKYYPNEFVSLTQLISTIKRKRRSAIIVLLANQIDVYSQYFNELCIADDVQKMPAGSRAIITTERGTKIYVERIERTHKAKRQDEIDTTLYYGFANPKLASITGDDWATANYQHIPDGEFDILYPNLYISYSDKLVRLDMVKHSSLGICMYVHWASRTYEDSIILSAAERTDVRFIYRTGRGALDLLIRRMFAENRVYYATNDVGNFCESYFAYIKKMRAPV